MSSQILVDLESAIHMAPQKANALAVLRSPLAARPYRSRDLPSPSTLSAPDAEGGPVQPEMLLPRSFHCQPPRTRDGEGYYAEPPNPRCQTVSTQSGAERWTLLPSSRQ